MAVIPTHPLRLKTFELLKHRPASIKLKDIAADTGLPLGWIVLFQQTGNKQSASFDRIALLYENLTGKTLG